MVKYHAKDGDVIIGGQTAYFCPLISNVVPRSRAPTLIWTHSPGSEVLFSSRSCSSAAIFWRLFASDSICLMDIRSNVNNCGADDLVARSKSSAERAKKSHSSCLVHMALTLMISKNVNRIFGTVRRFFDSRHAVNYGPTVLSVIGLGVGGYLLQYEICFSHNLA